MDTLDLLPLLPLIMLALLGIDWHQTPRNIADGTETNRAIMYLVGKFGPVGVSIWFGFCAVVTLGIFAVSMWLDRPGLAVVLGIFAIGLESTYVRENLQRQKGR